MWKGSILGGYKKERLKAGKGKRERERRGQNSGRNLHSKAQTRAHPEVMLATLGAIGLAICPCIPPSRPLVPIAGDQKV